MRKYAVHRSKFKFITRDIYTALSQYKKLAYRLGYSRLAASVGTCEDIHSVLAVKVQIIGHYMIRLLRIKCCKLDIVYATSLHIISALGIGFLRCTCVRLICRVHNPCLGKYRTSALQFFYILSPSYIVCKLRYEIRHVCDGYGYIFIEHLSHFLHYPGYHMSHYSVRISGHILCLISLRYSANSGSSTCHGTHSGSLHHLLHRSVHLKLTSCIKWLELIISLPLRLIADPVSGY